MMKLRIRMSDIPAETWMQMTLLKPDEANLFFPNAHTPYYLMQATWTFDPKQRQFQFVVMKKTWNTAIRAIPRRLRMNIKGPITITFLRDRRYNLSIKEWRPAVPLVKYHRIKKVKVAKENIF